MGRCYGRYCPLSHALDMVGERWALLLVEELSHGPQRYSDLATALGVGTNILAARLKELETSGIVSKRRLPPPAASQVYELTALGMALKPAIRELAMWGARSLGPPGPDADLFPGWLGHALWMAFGQDEMPEVRIEFRVGDEVAALADGHVYDSSVTDPAAVIRSDPTGIYHLFVEGDLSGVEIDGDRAEVERLLDAASRQPYAQSASDER